LISLIKGKKVNEKEKVVNEKEKEKKEIKQEVNQETQGKLKNIKNLLESLNLSDY
jgi:hypothetical protein